MTVATAIDGIEQSLAKARKQDRRAHIEDMLVAHVGDVREDFLKMHSHPVHPGEYPHLRPRFIHYLDDTYADQWSNAIGRLREEQPHLYNVVSAWYIDQLAVSQIMLRYKIAQPTVYYRRERALVLLAQWCHLTPEVVEQRYDRLY